MRECASTAGTVRTLAAVYLAVIGVCGSACGLTVTQDRPAFEDLDPYERSVVEIVLEELSGFNSEVKARTAFDIDAVVDPDRINVSFEGTILSANIGDNVVHVAAWENLSASQKKLVQTWFQAPDLLAAQSSYETLFYRFLSVSQGAKQYMYEALTTEWVFDHRSIYSVERDSIRVALSYFDAVGRRAEMWTFVDNACAPILSQYGPVYDATFSKDYFMSHIRELIADGKTPTGYMYYICRWIQMGQQAAQDLTFELEWLRDLRSA